MIRDLLYFLIITGLCFGQSIESDTSLKVHTDSFNKSLSVEIFGGKYFTFDHEMEFAGTTLPLFMWRGGGEISYQFLPNLVFSLAGGYSYTRNLGSRHNALFSPPELKFSLSNASFAVSYTNKILKNMIYSIGSGIDISYNKLFYHSYDPTINDTTVNTLSLRPLVSGSIRLNVIFPFYIKIRVESDFYHLVKIGSGHIHLGEILPSACIGIGYTLNLKRREP